MLFLFYNLNNFLTLKIIEEFQCKIATNEYNKNQELIAQKLAAKMDMIKVRNQQLVEQAENRKKQYENEFAEAVNARKIFAFNSELDEDYKMRKRRAAQSYKKVLLEQMEYNKMQKVKSL